MSERYKSYGLRPALCFFDRIKIDTLAPASTIARPYSRVSKLKEVQVNITHQPRPMFHFHDHLHPWSRHVIEHYPSSALADVHGQLCDVLDDTVSPLSRAPAMVETIRRIEECLFGRSYRLPMLFGCVRPGLILQAPPPQINVVYQQPPDMSNHLGDIPQGQLAITAPDTAGTSKFDTDTAGAKTIRRHIKKVEEKLDGEMQELANADNKEYEKRRLLDLEAERDMAKEKLRQEKILAANKERDIRERNRREKDDMRQDFERRRARSKERRENAENEQRERKKIERKKEYKTGMYRRDLESQERQAKMDKENRQAEDRRRKGIEDHPIRPAIEYASTRADIVGLAHTRQELGATFTNRPAQTLSPGLRSAAPDLYGCLGLDRGNNPAHTIISQAYKLYALRHHPDKDAGKTELEVQHSRSRMHEINLARDILLDEQRRAAYDERGITTLEAFWEWQRNRENVRMYGFRH